MPLLHLLFNVPTPTIVSPTEKHHQFRGICERPRNGHKLSVMCVLWWGGPKQTRFLTSQPISTCCQLSEREEVVNLVTSRKQGDVNRRTNLLKPEKMCDLLKSRWDFTAMCCPQVVSFWTTREGTINLWLLWCLCSNGIRVAKVVNTPTANREELVSTGFKSHKGEILQQSWFYMFNVRLVLCVSEGWEGCIWANSSDY